MTTKSAFRDVPAAHSSPSGLCKEADRKGAVAYWEARHAEAKAAFDEIDEAFREGPAGIPEEEWSRIFDEHLEARMRLSVVAGNLADAKAGRCVVGSDSVPAPIDPFFA